MDIRVSNTPNMIIGLTDENGNNIDLSLVEKVIVSFRVGNTMILTKTYPNEMTTTEEGLLLKFTQQDTIKFNNADDAEYDVKIKYKTGDVVSSDIYTISIKQQVNEEVV